MLTYYYYYTHVFLREFAHTPDTSRSATSSTLGHCAMLAEAPISDRFDVAAGRPMHLDELQRAHGSNGESIRVVGVLTNFDPEAARATLEHRNAALTVDTTAIIGHPFRTGDLLCCIGECCLVDTDPGGDALVLRARVVRVVNGLSLDVWDRGVDSLRAFVDAGWRLDPT